MSDRRLGFTDGVPGIGVEWLRWERDPDDETDLRPRVLLGVRDLGIERALALGLGAGGGGGYRIDRALDSATLLDRALQRGPRGVVVSENLAGLAGADLARLRREGAGVVVIAEPDSERAADWARLGVRIVDRTLGPEAILGAVRLALEAADRNEGLALAAPEDLHAPGDGAGTSGRIIALFGGKGSPGRTTVATSLAAGLASGGRRVALVDADLAGGDVVVFLGGLHPRANLFTLAHSALGRRDLDAECVERELQGWGESESLRVLVGLPKPGMATRISAPLVGGLLRYLRAAYPYVVVDLGAPGASGIGEVEAEVYARADLVVAVCGAELLAAWHLQHALAALRSRFAGIDDRLRLVLNRVDGRSADPESIAQALELTREPLAVVPFDRRAVRRTLEAQEPLVRARGRAGGALRGLVIAVERELEGRGRVGEEPPRTRPRRGLLARLGIGRRGRGS